MRVHSLPWAVCEYEDVFSNELPELPRYRDVDFTIELHPNTSLISMTPHRIASTELNSKFNYKNCRTRVLLDRALYLGAL